MRKSRHGTMSKPFNQSDIDEASYFARFIDTSEYPLTDLWQGGGWTGKPFFSFIALSPDEQMVRVWVSNAGQTL